MTKLTIQDWGMLIGGQVSTPVGEGVLLDVDYGSTLMVRDSKTKKDDYWNINNCKPILRTIRLTLEERNTKGDFLREYSGHIYKALETKWLIQHGFDIFGWIDAGLAVKKECQ